MNDPQNIADLINIIEKALVILPAATRNTLKAELEIIKEMIMKSRPPKIMILGRRGAGKSSLVNAIFAEPIAEVGSVTSQTGQAQWYAYQSHRGTLKILDTRGLGDHTRPESANFQEAIDEIKAVLRTDYPDVILFLCKAKEVDSRIAEDIRNIQLILEHIRLYHRYQVPVLALVTQVDELDPIDVISPPYDDHEKQTHITQALEALSRAFDRQSLPLMHVLPVSAYARFKDGKLLSQRYWNIDLLIEYLVEVLPKNAQLELARLSRVRSVQRQTARLIIGSSATLCAGIAAIPLPIADIIPLTSAQIAMVTGIAFIAGRELNQQSALEFLAALGVNIGAGFAMREISRAIAKFILPGGGSLISSGIAFATTWGIGEAAISYFIDGLNLEEAREKYWNEKAKHSKEDYSKNS
ncbi:MAG: GTPase [Microscillaceae bacterium]|nr:GTPase [Microscillaceae bacterium]